MNKHFSRLYFILIFSILFYSFNIYANDSVVNKNEIIEALSEPATRGIRIAPKQSSKKETASQQSENISPEQDSILASEHGLVVLDIKFEFNSSNLSPSAVNQLSELGQALSSKELAAGSFEISGTHR